MGEMQSRLELRCPSRLAKGNSLGHYPLIFMIAKNWSFAQHCPGLTIQMSMFRQEKVI